MVKSWLPVCSTSSWLDCWAAIATAAVKEPDLKWYHNWWCLLIKHIGRIDIIKKNFNHAFNVNLEIYASPTISTGLVYIYFFISLLLFILQKDFVVNENKQCMCCLGRTRRVTWLYCKLAGVEVLRSITCYLAGVCAGLVVLNSRQMDSQAVCDVHVELETRSHEAVQFPLEPPAVQHSICRVKQQQEVIQVNMLTTVGLLSMDFHIRQCKEGINDRLSLQQKRLIPIWRLIFKKWVTQVFKNS